MNKTKVRKKFRIGVAMLSALFISMFGVVAVAGLGASARGAGRDPRRPGSRPQRGQRDDHRPPPVQLRQRRPYLRPGRRVQRLLQRDQRRPALQRELLLRRRRVFARHDRVRSWGGPLTGHPERHLGRNGTSLGNTTHRDTLYIPVPCSAIRRRPSARRRRPASTTRRPSTCHASPVPFPGSPSPSSVSQRADPRARPRGRHPQRWAARMVERRGRRDDRARRPSTH